MLRTKAVLWCLRGINPSVLSCAVIAGATLAAYHAGFSAPFVFDDEPAIINNPSIRHLERIGDVLSPPLDATGATARPVVNLTLAINYAIGGLDVRGYRVVNLAIEIFGAWTLFGIVRRTVARRAAPSAGNRIRSGAMNPVLVAFMVVLLWSIHPLQTESVMGVIQRDEALAGLCYLLTLYCFIRGMEAAEMERPVAASQKETSKPDKLGGRKVFLWLGLSWLSCLVGMATKEIMASVPLIALLYDRTFVAGTFLAVWRRRRLFYLALTSTWLLSAWLIIGSGNRGSVGFDLGVTWWQYLLTQCRAIVLYLQLSFWPHPLAIDYGTSLAKGLWDVLPQAILLVLLAGGTVVGLVRRSALGFLGAWFFLILAPSSSVVPLVTQTMAEHRMYLPLAAVIVSAVVGLHAWAGPRSGWVWPVLAIGLAFLTARRVTDYLDPSGLWRGALAAWPGNSRAYLNLGTLADRQGLEAEALADYEQARRLDPNAEDIHRNLGVVLEKTGRLAEAVVQYQEAVRLGPKLAVAHYCLGLALIRTGRSAEAIPQLEDALRLQPDSSVARRSLAAAECDVGNDLAKTDRLTEAAGHYQAALRLLPGSAPLHYDLAKAFSLLGRHTEAIAHYESAVRLQPDYADAHDNLATELWEAGRLAEAKAEYKEVLRLRPDDDQARRQLARIEAQEQNP